MSHTEPQFDAGATRIDIGKGSVKTILVALPLLIAVCVASVGAAVDAPDRATTMVGIFFSSVFGLLLLFVLRAIPRFVEPRGVVLDARGLHFWRRSEWDLLPWSEVAAIGIGYDRARRPPVVRLSRYLAEQALSALKVEQRRHIAIEIFPKAPATLDSHPGLARYRREQPPPRDGLPFLHWRVPLPPMGGAGDKIDQAVQALRPGLRLGWFERAGRRAMLAPSR